MMNIQTGRGGRKLLAESMGQSIVDLMLPQQIMYNVASARITSMMQDEAGYPDPSIVESLRPKVNPGIPPTSVVYTDLDRVAIDNWNRDFERDLMWGSTYYMTGRDLVDTGILPRGIWQQLTGNEAPLIGEPYKEYLEKKAWEDEQSIELEF